MATILYKAAYTTANYTLYNSLIPAEVKASFLTFKELYLTVTWDPLYGASFRDTRKKTRTETVRINRNLEYNMIYDFKYFPNDAGYSSSWYENPGTLLAGIINDAGELRIIIDECSGFLAKYYTGAFEPDYLRSIVISDNPIYSVCTNAPIRISINAFLMSVYTLNCS